MHRLTQEALRAAAAKLDLQEQAVAVCKARTAELTAQIEDMKRDAQSVGDGHRAALERITFELQQKQAERVALDQALAAKVRRSE